MTRHLIRLAWNRRGSNFLLLVEIFFSFVVLFGVVLLATTSTSNWRRPLGFVGRDVWVVELQTRLGSNDEWDAHASERIARMLRELRSLPGVRAAAGSAVAPYQLGGMSSSIEHDGRRLSFEADEATDDFAKVLGLPLRRGRWFGPEDDGAAYDPVVIDEPLARQAFGDADPIGRSLRLAEPGTRPDRVVGVVAEYRKGGELSSPGRFLFNRIRLSDPKSRPPATLFLAMAPGTPRAVEEEIVSLLRRLAPDWSFEVKPLSELRAAGLRLRLAPLVVLGTVAVFLLLMVALGLTGVLWQSVTRRRNEIGLRRAEGATAAAIRRQIVGETLVLTAAAVAAGSLLLAQGPFLGLSAFVPAPLYFASLTLAAALLLGLTAACALAPAHVATRIAPVDALRYE